MNIEAVYEGSKIAIEKEVDKLKRTLDHPHKILIGKCLECTISCYLKNESLNLSKGCIEKCNFPVGKVEEDIESRFRRISTSFDRCTESCHRNFVGQANSLTEPCIKKCTKSTIREIRETQDQILNSYSYFIGKEEFDARQDK